MRWATCWRRHRALGNRGVFSARHRFGDECVVGVVATVCRVVDGSVVVLDDELQPANASTATRTRRLER